MRCHCSGQAAGHSTGFAKFWQLRFRNADGIQHCLPVALVINVKVEAEGGNRHIRQLDTGQIVDHIILQQHISPGIVIDLRTVLPQPGDLSGRPGRQHCHLSGDCLTGSGIKLLFQFCALLDRALIHPGDRIHQRFAISAYRHQGFCLTGKGDLADLRHAVCFQHICQQRYQFRAVRRCVKFHKTVFPDIHHRTALPVDQVKFPVINGSFDIGAAKINAYVHSFPHSALLFSRSPTAPPGWISANCSA